MEVILLKSNDRKERIGLAVSPSELCQAPSEVAQEEISVWGGLMVRVNAAREKMQEEKYNVGEGQQPGCRH